MILPPSNTHKDVEGGNQGAFRTSMYNQRQFHAVRSDMWWVKANSPTVSFRFQADGLDMQMKNKSWKLRRFCPLGTMPAAQQQAVATLHSLRITNLSDPHKDNASRRTWVIRAV